MADEAKIEVKVKKRKKTYARYGVKIRITQSYQPILKELVKRTGLKPKEIFLQAVEEKYGVRLHSPLDKSGDE